MDQLKWLLEQIFLFLEILLETFKETLNEFLIQWLSGAIWWYKRRLKNVPKIIAEFYSKALQIIFVASFVVVFLYHLFHK